MLLRLICTEVSTLMDTRLATLIRHLIFDVLGLTLLALGIVRLQIHLVFLPAIFHFAHDGWIYIVAGLLLILPTARLAFRFFSTTENQT